MEVVSYLYFLLLCTLLPVVLFKCIRKTDGCLTQDIILAIAIFVAVFSFTWSKAKFKDSDVLSFIYFIFYRKVVKPYASPNNQAQVPKIICWTCCLQINTQV